MGYGLEPALAVRYLVYQSLSRAAFDAKDGAGRPNMTGLTNMDPFFVQSSPH